MTIRDGSAPINPIIKITEAPKDIKEEELLFSMISVNEDLNEQFGARIRNELKLKGTRTHWNPNKANLFVRGPADIIKYMLKQKYVYLDLVRLYVEEHLNIIVCYKCCRCGHSGKYSTEEKDKLLIRGTTKR